MTAKELTQKIVAVLDDKKAKDIKAIETREVTIVADYFVIASGTSSTHTKALADEVEHELAKLDILPRGIEGRATGWVLLDYNSVLVHIFQPEQREYYTLERLWSDAQQMDISGIVKAD